MSIGEFLGTTGGKAVAIGGGAVIAIGIAAAVLMQGDGYRSISVEQVSGTVSIVGEKNNGQAYIGEHLYSGDDVTVADASELTMCMDNDKYVYADANTHFQLEASGAKEDSRIKIYLDAGSELNVLESKLGGNDTYEVDTPNSTMSVRGTTFRVTVYTAKDGLVYTLLEVSDGTVLARLKTADGNYNGAEGEFTAGQSAFIRGNDLFSEFVTSGMLNAEDITNTDSDGDVLMLAYDSLPEGGMERLIALLENSGIADGDDNGNDDSDTGRSDTSDTMTPVPTPTAAPPESEEQVADDTGIDTEGDENRPAPIRSIRDTLRQQAMVGVVGTDSETGAMILADGTVFDPVFYAEDNPDVVEEFGSSPEDLLTHYQIFGRAEDRPPSLAAAIAKEETYRQFAEALAESEEEAEPADDSSSGSESSSDAGDSGGSSGTGGSNGSSGTSEPQNVDNFNKINWNEAEIGKTASLTTDNGTYTLEKTGVDSYVLTYPDGSTAESTNNDLNDMISKIR